MTWYPQQQPTQPIQNYYNPPPEPPEPSPDNTLLYLLIGLASILIVVLIGASTFAAYRSGLIDLPVLDSPTPLIAVAPTPIPPTSTPRRVPTPIPPTSTPRLAPTPTPGIRVYDVHVGTGYDQSTNQVTGESSSFSRGTTVWMVFTATNTLGDTNFTLDIYVNDALVNTTPPAELSVGTYGYYGFVNADDMGLYVLDIMCNGIAENNATFTVS